jgi:hypothetical protein
MLQDVIKNRRTEIDYLNGYVSDEGKKVGVPTPFCDAASALVRAAGVGGISPDPSETQETKTQGLLSFLFWPHLIFFWQSDDLSRQARDRQTEGKLNSTSTGGCCLSLSLCAENLATVIGSLSESQQELIAAFRKQCESIVGAEEEDEEAPAARL